jgi:hypothetical protein
MTHDLQYPPTFFDTGTFRRMFAFELKPQKVEEYDTVANLYKQNHEKELQEYMNIPCEEFGTLGIQKEAIDEIVNFFLTWNKFLFLNPNQRIRSVARGLMFAGKIYFFRLAAILSVTKGEPVILKDTARLACIDAVQFLLKTIEIYCNKSNPTLSRDTWKTGNMQEAMFFEWLHYNGAIDQNSSNVSISQAQDQIGDYFGLMERQAKNVYHNIKKRGLIQDHKGKHDSKVWLAFKPDLKCPINFKEDKFPDLREFLASKMEEV